MRKYNETHQWVELENGVATVGITAHAAEEMGEITFIELPPLGTVFMQDDVLCIVESAKAASDVLTPIGGTVSEINLGLEKTPDLINASPEGEGWICKFTDVAEEEMDNLMSEDEYDIFVETEMEGEE